MRLTSLESCEPRVADMQQNQRILDRRQALQILGLGGTAVLSGASGLVAGEPRKKLPVAGVVTHYTKNSHADVILGKILEGWRQGGGAGPDLELVSLYTDQVPFGDISRQMADTYDVPIVKTIDQAVTFGLNDVPVAGVIAIGEHGDYPLTKDTKQKQYPRRRFFDDIVAAMRRCGRYVPVFNDKHLGYTWRDAYHMVAAAKRHNIPFMAGSSLPVAWRYPAELLPVDCEIEEAIAVAYGPLESYGFHALESLQCIVERRRGGETGVAAVTTLMGSQIWEAEKQRHWSRDLLTAAVETFKGSIDNLEQRLSSKDGAFFRLEYRDGLTGAVAMLNGVVRQFGVACRLRGKAEPIAFWFRLEDQAPFGHFEHLLRGIQHLIHTRQSPYPVERTLLTTGVLDRAMHSLAQRGTRLLSPELALSYQPSEWGFANVREENFPR